MKPINSKVTSNIDDNNTNFYKELFDKSFSIMLLIDPNTCKILKANNAACNFYGYSQNEITQLKISDINILSENEIKKEILNAKNHTRNFFNFKHRLANNNIRDVEVYVNNVNYNGQDVLFSVTHDVTEKKLNKRLLEISERKYRHLTESITDCVFTINLYGKFTYLNKAFENITKYKVNDFLGKHFNEIICPEYVEESNKNFLEGLQKETSSIYEIEIFDKNKNRIPIEIKASSLLNENNTIIGRTGIFRDITEKKLIEKERKRNEENFKSFVENAADIIVLIDKNGIIKYVNKVSEKLTGYKKNEVIGTSITNYIIKDDIDTALNALAGIMNGNINITFESSLIHKDGSLRPFLSNGKKFLYNDKFVNMVIIKDITHIKEAEKELSETKELYQSIFETSGTAMLIMSDKFDEIEMANKEFMNLVGAPDKNSLKTWAKYLSKESLLLLEKYHLSRIENPENTPSKYPVKIQHYDGSFKEVIVNAALLSKSKKTIISIIDVTEQNKTLRQLEESERRFREMSELLPQTVFEADLEGNIIYANKFAIKSFGYTQEELDEGLNFLLMLSPESRVVGKKNYKEKLQGEQVDIHEYIAQKKDGTTFPIILSSIPILKEGRVVGVRGVITDLTIQKKAEEKIIESEKLLIEAERIAKIGFWKIYHKENKTEWSDEIFRIIGEKPQSFKPTYSNFIEAIHPDDIEKVFNLNKSPLDNGKKRSTEFRIVSKKGKIKHVKEIWTTKYDKKGNPEITIGIVQDITTQKNNEIILKESEKRYRDLFYKSKDPTLLLYDNKIIDCNIETAKVLEKNSINDIIGKSLFELSAKYQEDGKLSKDKILENIKIAYKKGYNRFEWEHITFKGNIIYIEISLTPITINKKRMLYVIWRDISKRKKAEKEINKLNIAVKQSPSVVIITDKKGNIEYINPAFTKVTGYTLDEAIGQNPRILASGKTPKKEYKKLWGTITSGRVWEGELYNKKKDNTFYWEKIIISPVKNNKGKIINYIAIKTDITKQKEIEQKEKETRANLIKVNNKFKKQNIEIKLQNKLLTESKNELLTIQKELDSVINASKAIFIEVDSNYKVLRWNKSAVKITGILATKIVGRSIKELNLNSKINNLIIGVIEDCLKGKTVKEKEITFKSSNGEIQTILISSDAKLNSDNIIIGVFIVAQDITAITNYNKYLELIVEERTQELKEALLKEKELSELKSKFVSVVSHEFRTPLSAINFSANFINNYFEKLEKDKIKQKLKNIEAQVKHMTMLLDDVLIMGRIQSNRVVFKPEIINAREYFKPIIEEVYISKNKTHKIIYSENVKDAKICVDKVQARNIFINLLSNAIKFSPNSNEVYIKVDVNSKNTKVTVTDTGIGIKDIDEVFKPFVRGVNADNIQGTGLGLSIVKEAVKKHKGKINVNTKINEGTSIEVILPNNQETKN